MFLFVLWKNQFRISEIAIKESVSRNCMCLHSDSEKNDQGTVASWESRYCKKVSSNVHSINYMFSGKKKIKKKSRIPSLLWCGKRCGIVQCRPSSSCVMFYKLWCHRLEEFLLLQVFSNYFIVSSSRLLLAQLLQGVIMRTVETSVIILFSQLYVE